MIANSQILLANNSEEFNLHMKDLVANLQSQIDALLESQPKVLSGLKLQLNATNNLNKGTKTGIDLEKERFATSLSGVRSLIKAYLAQAIASAVAVEVGSKGLVGLATGTAVAVGVSAIFDNYVPQFAQGGIVPGTGNRDTVPAMLTPGELILNQAQQENLVANSGITINISAPLVDETVVESIIPAIERAKSLGTA